MLNLAKLRRD